MVVISWFFNQRSHHAWGPHPAYFWNIRRLRRLGRWVLLKHLAAGHVWRKSIAMRNQVHGYILDVV